MNFFVFDLEATCWPDNRGKEQEIIEIGACIIDRYGSIKSTFNSFVRPVMNPGLSPYCKGLTHISQKDVDNARMFPQVINKMMDWAELPDEEYIFCAWGSADLKLMQSNAALHRFELEWLNPYVDIKSQYHQRKDIATPAGLYKVLKHHGMEFEGERHRALSDALNLSRIIVRYIDEWVY
ncbi:MAG: exonuclease domain-containing protein [Saprospiraceae bacterium]|nr:exonuclease domain-containing protein [Saprospiraceae bacterium]HMW39278.1 3'-5' exonuclease [Saprospiraceae bacterium]HMX89088.1 3'-5' exonuclease [Saprospiraceae bacterium]HMZ40959.1 3'-5' exonuclease [Saprospiraceae bacterium]HNA65096.1 3'-5' exonuclease [Saprospiraceae bacterium]